MAESATDPLLLLIRSLTTGEKNHFHRSVSKGGDNKYLILFNIIESLPEASEKQIQSEYKRKTGNTGQYARIKAYLYHRVIESLSDYHTRNVPRVEIHELLKQAEVLLLKQLRTPLRDVLKRARQLVEDAEAWEMMPELIWREKASIPIELSPDEIYEQIQKLNLQLSESLNNIHELHEIGDISFLLATETNNEFRYSEIEYRERLGRITSNPTFQKPFAAFNSERARISVLSMRAFYYLAVNDYEGFVREAEKLFERLRHSEKATTEHYLRYANNLANVIVALHLLKRPADALPYLTEFEKLLQLLGSMGFREKYNPLYVLYLLSRARILFALDRFTEVIELQAQFIAIESAVLWSAATNWRRQQFFILLSGAYLLDNQPKIASRIISRALQDDSGRKRPFAEELRQLELAISYDLNDEDRMESLIASLRRKQNKLDPKEQLTGTNAYETACYVGWTELMHHRGQQPEQKLIFRQLYHELTTQRLGKPEHDERTRFVFERWIKKKADEGEG
ncbi:MAG: hypothetical protein MUC87_07130 [Bacteroidia bacterium]|jgi:hypothetical protein|nr:hypothetical protein [Bacteroidia bacterium]